MLCVLGSVALLELRAAAAGGVSGGGVGGRAEAESAAAKPAGPATRRPTSFGRCDPIVTLLDKIARESGGQVVDAAGLAALVAELPNRRVPITEPAITPLWHQPWVFLLAIVCLCGEWGLRRWRGLP